MSKTWKINTDDIPEPRRGSKKFTRNKNSSQGERKQKRSVRQRSRLDVKAWTEAYA